MSTRAMKSLFLALAVVILPRPAASLGAGARIPVQSESQLPRHSYPVPESAAKLVQDDAQFASLAAKLGADLRSDLAKYAIGDRATLKEYFGTLGSLALISGDFEAAVAYADSVRAVEDKPGPRALAGTLERALAVASRAPEADRKQAFADAYRREIAAVPYDAAQAEIKTLKGAMEMMSPGVLVGAVQALVEPAAKSGEISRQLANRVVSARRYLKVVQPVQGDVVTVLGEVIAAHTTQKPDIWAARDVSLDGRTGLTPVVIAVWDSGVDESLFKDRLFVNAKEIPDNGVDDDGDGYVDDVHGIAHGLHSERTTGALHTLTIGSAGAQKYQARLKGYMDMRAGLDSPEASELKKIVAGMKPEEVQPFYEGFGEYLEYAHGTHVTGIAVAGNPAARVLNARMTSDAYLMKPECPTLELARASAQELRESIEYFRSHGVRVVNMSWGAAAVFFEQMLEANNAGGTPEQRKALARQLYQIGASALREAMQAAPDVLFIAAAGNEDNDVQFGDFAPASFDLPNLITAGAVDRAGDEAAFTSYGKVQVYANGYEVESFLPGGARCTLSGTSMAAPQVVNLAAKLLAVHPDLTVAQLREAILRGADEKKIGEGKTIMLLDPRRSLDIVEGRRAGK